MGSSVVEGVAVAPAIFKRGIYIVSIGTVPPVPAPLCPHLRRHSPPFLFFCTDLPPFPSLARAQVMVGPARGDGLFSFCLEQHCALQYQVCINLGGHPQEGPCSPLPPLPHCLPAYMSAFYYFHFYPTTTAILREGHLPAQRILILFLSLPPFATPPSFFNYCTLSIHSSINSSIHSSVYSFIQLVMYVI